MVLILRAISRQMRRRYVPNTTVCPVDGCLLRKREACPACAVRTAPKYCECGRRIRNRAHERCAICRKQPALPDEHAEKRGPMRWVRHGLIWRPVYEQREVA